MAASLVACDPGSAPEPPTPPPSDPVLEPEAEPEEAEPPAEPPEPACLESVATLFERADADATVALRLTDAGGMAATLDASGLHTRALTAEGATRGPPQAVEMEGASRLFGLEPFAEGRWVALATGSCSESAHCLLARELEAGGEGRGTVVAAALPGPITTARRAASEGRVYVAWSAAGERGLELYLDMGSLGRARRSLGTRAASEELPVEILGLAARGDRWAALLRQGAGEDERSHVFLATDAGSSEVEALHEALVVESMERGARDVTLAVGFEMSRPHLVRIAPGAAEPSDARELAMGEPVPEPFAERVRVGLDVGDDGLSMTWRDGAGDVLREAMTVVRGAIGAAAVARRGDASLVAWVAEDEVRMRWVRCR